jgi:hypothetical protein
MENKMKFKNLWLIAGVFATAGLPLTAGAERSKSSSLPLIAPINTSPAGQTYGHWAAEWWEWVIGVPATVNPNLDSTGENCAQRQVGEVWFLAGSFSPDPVVRACEIPAGKSLFFPLINNAYFAFLNDTPDTRTEQYVRATGSCSEPAQISVQIDNFNVPNPDRYFTGPSGSQSPIFNIQLPPGNIFGDDVTVIPELLLSPSAEQGYYLFLKPLSAGVHTIQWTASGCTLGGQQDIKYRVTVLGSPEHH